MLLWKNRVRKSAARRNRVPAKPNRFCGMEERQPIKAKPYFYKKYGKPKGLPRRGGDGGKNFGHILSVFMSFLTYCKRRCYRIYEGFCYFVGLTEIRRFFENRVKIVYGFIRFCWVFQPHVLLHGGRGGNMYSTSFLYLRDPNAVQSLVCWFPH